MNTKLTEDRRGIVSDEEIIRHFEKEMNPNQSTYLLDGCCDHDDNGALISKVIQTVDGDLPVVYTSFINKSKEEFQHICHKFIKKASRTTVESSKEHRDMGQYKTDLLVNEITSRLQKREMRRYENIKNILTSGMRMSEAIKSVFPTYASHKIEARKIGLKGVVDPAFTEEGTLEPITYVRGTSSTESTSFKIHLALEALLLEYENMKPVDYVRVCDYETEVETIIEVEESLRETVIQLRDVIIDEKHSVSVTSKISDVDIYADCFGKLFHEEDSRSFQIWDSVPSMDDDKTEKLFTLNL